MKTLVGAAGAGVLLLVVLAFRPVDCPGCGALRERFGTEEPLDLSCLDCGDRGRVATFRKGSPRRGLSNPWIREIETYGRQAIDTPRMWSPPSHTPDESRAAFPVLLLALRTGKDDLPVAAANCLGHMGPLSREAVPVLIDALRSENYKVRRVAAGALGSIHAAPDKVVPRLIDLLRDEHFLVRWAAALALRDFGPAAAPAVPALMETLRDPDPHVRRRAGEALTGLAKVLPAAKEALPLIPPETE